MSVNPASDPHSDADSQTPRNAVEDLQALLVRLESLQMDGNMLGGHIEEQEFKKWMRTGAAKDVTLWSLVTNAAIFLKGCPLELRVGLLNISFELKPYRNVSNADLVTAEFVKIQGLITKYTQSQSIPVIHAEVLSMICTSMKQYEAQNKPSSVDYLRVSDPAKYVIGEVTAQSHQDPMNILNDLSCVFSRLGWLLNEDTGLIDLSLPCFEIGYMLKPVSVDKPKIKAHDITLKMNYLRAQITYFDLIVKKQNTTLKNIIEYAVNGISYWKEIHSNRQPPAKPVVPSPQPVQSNNTITVFGNGWIAWSEVHHPNSIIFTKDNVHFYRDSMSNWRYYRTPTFGYFQHKNAGPNPNQPNDCYVHVPSRQCTEGQFITDLFKDFHHKTLFASKLCTSNIAGSVGQVRPCRCEGYPGCDGTPGNCHCIGRCRCADADA
jgi:hypothetical protein